MEVKAESLQMIDNWLRVRERVSFYVGKGEVGDCHCMGASGDPETLQDN